MNYKLELLGGYIKEVSRRNRDLHVSDVFSVTNTEGFIKSTEYFDKEVFSKNLSNYKIVSPKQFAYNPSRINVGSIDYLKSPREVIISPLYVVFSCNEKLHEEYLKIFLKSSLGNYRIRSKTKGAVRDTLSFRSLSEIKIPIPLDFEDQIRITTVLSKAEELIKQRKESIALLDELVKSVFLEMFGDPARNEKGWEVKSLNQISDSRLGKMLDINKQTNNDRFKYLANYNVQWFSFNLGNLQEMDFSERERQELALEEGDLLICEGGEVGRTAIWKNDLENCYFQKALHRVRPYHALIKSEYLAFVFWFIAKKTKFKNVVGSATIPHLTGIKLKKLKIPVPPISSQKSFTIIVEKVEALKKEYDSSLKELENLYGSLSQRAFKGELDLRKVEVELTENENIEEKELTKFQKMQIIGALIYNLELNNQRYGEMILAKYLYLADRLLRITTGLKYRQWHFGPYDPEIKKLINSKNGYFTRDKNGCYSLVKKESLLKYPNQEVELINKKFSTLAELFNRYKKPDERKNKIELLASVCKVIEEKRSVNEIEVLNGMKEWKTDKQKTGFENKGDKFSEKEILKSIQFIVNGNYDKLLLSSSPL